MTALAPVQKASVPAISRPAAGPCPARIRWRLRLRSGGRPGSSACSGSTRRNTGDLTRLQQEILPHLAEEIEATRPDGFADDKIRIVTENSRVLKFEQSDFEWLRQSALHSAQSLGRH